MTFSFVQFIILFLVLSTSTIFVYSFTNNVTDLKALLSVKASITGDPLGVLSSWNNSVHFCQWTGITCSPIRQRVTALNLSYQNLVGTLSPHIGNLSFLRRIYLIENNFHGTIPNDLGRLFRLQDLYLEVNSFEGGFPMNLSHCTEMRNMSLYGNNLKGKLPNEFASWPKLHRFGLGKNYFTGSIPPSIGNISKLRHLDLGYNNLAGLVPLELTLLTNLNVIRLAVNSFSGMMPQSLYNISSLYIVTLAANELEGTLPKDLGFTLPKLQHFYNGGNRFSGQLPPSIVNASNLISFDIADNNIKGPIPNNLGSLSNLQWLSLSNNPLGDGMRPDDLSFINSLVNCTHLKVLTLSENNLRGEFPNSMVNLSTTLEKLFFYGNQIYGSIPRDIGKLENIIELSLFGNLLAGTIPESIAELSKLGALDLNGNRIVGVIPTCISNITQLTFLGIENNMLQGSIPAELFNISTLDRMSLANNRLTGVIPEQIAFSSNIYLDLSQNQFTGPLTSKIGSLKHLVTLDVSDNKFTGDIPITLGGCVMLEFLYMEGNLFQGTIPSSFKDLKNLKVLDLSRNNISENIPTFFDEFHIEFLNLSHNKLGGEVPREGLFANISAFSVVGNLKLCGGVQALHLPACPVKVSRNKKKTFALRLILLLVFVPLGILSICLAALICYRCRNFKKLNDLVPVLKDNQYLKLSYQDLLLATNEFSPDNLLGEGRYGSVYKGFLNSEEHIVAVKVLNVEVRGANKSFLAECEMLRNIRHRNLTKIITACSSTDFKGNDFKALVFEFMINGSVENWLHPSPYSPVNERNLTLLQRLNISIDVAQGLDYLHHHSHASIIHSDIKPSNILLDKDFIAHIGDFGLARFSFATTSDDVNQEQMSSTGGVRGTIGYVPPEYGMCGKISTEGDVYSYGILLLEIFSGKRPTESNISLDNGSNLHDYVRKALPQRVMDIVDPRILLDQEHELTMNQSYSRVTMELCLASIFEVGLLCSDETPQNRIGISVAIKQLLEARGKLLLCSQKPG